MMTAVRKNKCLGSKAIIALLIFSPLLYSNDGDQFRAFKVLLVALLFLVFLLPRVGAIKSLLAPPLLYVLCMMAFIIFQPLFVQQASLVYNINFAIVLACSFVPMLFPFAKINLNDDKSMGFLGGLFEFLFILVAVSLLISYFWEVGEVYSEGRSVRAFAWLGDSFSPVMVFYIFYYALRGRWLLVALAIGLLLFVMQAKMALAMALFGFIFYALIFLAARTRLLLVAGVIIIGFFADHVFDFFVGIIHNFQYSMNNRLLSMDAGLTFFWSSPWWGVGANQTFKILSEGVDLTVLNRFDASLPYYEFYQIHNSFIRILAELGLFGFTLFFLFCVSLVRKSCSILTYAHLLPLSERTRPLIISSSLWVISFVISYQTTGWFEPGHPQLSWLLVFFTLMTILSPARSAKIRRASE